MHDFPSSRYLKTLLGAGICFNLRHLLFSIKITPLRRSRTFGTLFGPLQAMPPFVGRVAKVGKSLRDHVLITENFVQRLDKMGLKRNISANRAE